MPWFRRLLVLVVCLSGLLAVASAQWRVMEGNLPPRFPPSSLPDRDFAFCKIMYNSVRYEDLGMGWATDYPFAGINLMIRFSELTTGRVSFDGRGDPNHWVVRFTDDALFSCPFTMASDVGTIGFSPAEAVRLRHYLLKGGFLWVDDFWGTRAWQHWESEIAKVLWVRAITERRPRDRRLREPDHRERGVLDVDGHGAGRVHHGVRIDRRIEPRHCQRSTLGNR